MVSRRVALGMSLAVVGAASSVVAQQRRSLSDPLRLGVDPALIESGLARALQQGFGRDTGVAVQVVRSPTLPLLDALDRAEFDATLSNVPDAEARLEQQGLAHDRHAIAAGAFVIVGPAPKGKLKDPAGIAGARSVAEALVALRDAALATPGAITFLSAGDGSGTHAMEQALWRRARLAPAAPWYATADASGSLSAQARARGA